MTIDLAYGALIAAPVFIAVLWLSQRRSAAVREHRVRQLSAELDDCVRRADDASGQLDAVLAASEDAIILVDGDGACHMLNEQARNLFGKVAEGNRLLGATQSNDLDLLLQRAQRGVRDLVVGEVILRAFGDRAMQVRISLIGGDAEHAAERYLVLLRDITDLRRLETVRRDFVANVSHELRTPLTSIKAMAETLLDGAVEDAAVARRFLDTIVHETDRLVRLAADLLDLSRIEMRPVTKEDTDIAMLIDDAVERLASQRNKAGLILTFEVERPLVAPCDADEVSQVLINLIDNAIKYTPRGGTLSISAHRDKGRIAVEVSDTGIGILQQDLPRLFERFYRTDKARSRQSGGTGLGLSIVKHIVERHGGELWVRSEYNRGSTFGFALPRPSAAAGIVARLDRLQGNPTSPRAGEYIVVGTAKSSDVGGVDTGSTGDRAAH